MNHKHLKVVTDDFPSGYTSLNEFCYHMKNKNLVVLHLLEKYAGVSLESDPQLQDIRKIILDVSGNVNRLPYNLFVEDDVDARLQ